MAAAQIESVLIKNTSLSEDQVAILLEQPAATGAANGATMRELLTRKDAGTPDEILSDLAGQLGLTYLKDIPVNEINADLVRDIPIGFAKKHEVLPFKETKEGSESIQILITNPLNTSTLDDLRVLFQKRVVPVMTSKTRIIDAINKVYERSTAALQGLEGIDEEEMDLDDPIIDLLEAGDDDAPVIKLVNTLLFRAVKEKASDIHIEPYERDMAVRFRIDGVLFDIFKPSKKLQNSITSRIKVMGNLNIAEKRLPQDGRIPLKLGGKDIDVRLSTVPTAFGERLVMRLQDRSNVVLQLEQLGFSESSLDILRDDLLKRTYGIILVTGPTGSGKSTTLYAALTRINNSELNILTIEDPVEQRIHGIGQVQTNSKIGLNFAAGLRSFLRQDPDVIMVGEIRDLETAELAIQASLTGHLVFSTLHTNDAAGAFPRLMDFGCEPFLIATSIQGVVSQRLVRILCPHCKTPHVPTDGELVSLGLSREAVHGATIYRATGCDHCNGKGYQGRTNIQELLLVTDDIRSMIMQRRDGGAIKKKALELGMKTFRDHGIEKVLKGITTIEEVLSNTQIDL
ncbi:MAG: type II secretion system ATPase GspE [Bdellovibrionales bacterium]|jgi:general secretion pathway protein E|nr:type II secretion system ATPase GspE [Bdellovibrionales bacterium]